MNWRRWISVGVLAAGLLGIGTGCRVSEDGGGEEGEAAGAVPGREAGAEQAEDQVLSIDPNDNRPVNQRLRDVSIAANIKVRLVEQAGVDPNMVDLLVQNGQVTMQGETASPEQRAQAESAAKAVEGVRQVVNQLAVAGGPAPTPQSAIPPVTGQPKPATPPANAPATAASQPPGAHAKPGTPPAQAPQPKPAEKPVTYKVKSGDTLGAIARRNGTTVEKLKQLNGLKNNNLSIGQTLRVK